MGIVIVIKIKDQFEGNRKKAKKRRDNKTLPSSGDVGKMSSSFQFSPVPGSLRWANRSVFVYTDKRQFQ